MVDRRRRTPASAAASKVDSETLAQLARAAVKGSGVERDRFLDACWHYAYDAARRLKRQHQGAEDSAQDAMMAVFRLLRASPPAIKPETVAAFVSVVVLRSAHATARRRLREAMPQAPAPRAPRDIVLEAETNEWARRVQDIVAGLPPRFRRLVELRYWEDMSCEQIARQVGRSRMSVTRLLEQAEAALRSSLGEIDGTAHGRPRPSHP